MASLSEIRQSIQSLANSVNDIQAAKDAADLATQYVQSLEAGEITPSEFLELQNDIVNLRTVDSTMDSIDSKKRFNDFLTDLISLIQIAAKVPL